MTAVPRSFFSVELCFPFARANRVHDEVRRILARTHDEVPSSGKWANHRAVADVLLAHIDEAARGCWEYMDDDSSDAMWNDWLLPLTDRSRQPKGEQAGGFFTATLMLQAQRSSSTDQVLQRAFRAAKDALWTRGTFAAMLQSIPAISFASVVRDSLYLMPRDSTRGFTEEELATERMKYLRVLG